MLPRRMQVLILSLVLSTPVNASSKFMLHSGVTTQLLHTDRPIDKKEWLKVDDNLQLVDGKLQVRQPFLINPNLPRLSEKHHSVQIRQNEKLRNLLLRNSGPAESVEKSVAKEGGDNKSSEKEASPRSLVAPVTGWADRDFLMEEADSGSDTGAGVFDACHFDAIGNPNCTCQGQTCRSEQNSSRVSTDASEERWSNSDCCTNLIVGAIPVETGRQWISRFRLAGRKLSNLNILNRLGLKRRSAKVGVSPLPEG